MDYTIFEGFMDGILVLSKQGEVKFANTSAVTILRLSSQKKVLGKTLSDEIDQFATVELKNADAHLVFSELRIERKSPPNLTLMVGLRTIPGTEDCLLYLRDLTIEISLQRKFDSERSGKQQALQSAHTDSLTGCLNKAGLLSSLEMKWKRLTMHGGLFSLLVLDLDGFKAINDQHGHAAGDAFLKEVAAQIRDCMRDRDSLGRFGGDEFVVQLNDCSQTESLVVARRILKRLRQFSLKHENAELRVTASIGLAEFSKAGAQSWEEFFQMADLSSLQAKKSGKNAICIHPEETPIQD